MSLLDDIFFPLETVRSANQLAQYKNQQALAQLKASRSAQAQLGLSPDPITGKMIPASQMPSTDQDVLSSEVFGQRKPTAIPPNLLGIQQDYKTQQQGLLDQIDPDAAVKARQALAGQQRHLDYVRANFPTAAQSIILAGDEGKGGEEWAKMQTANMTTTPEAKNRDAALAALQSNPPGSPTYKAAQDYLASIGETVRHNKVDEGATAARDAATIARDHAANIVPTVDVNTGQTSFVDKTDPTKITTPSFPDPYASLLNPGGQAPQNPAQQPGAPPPLFAQPGPQQGAQPPQMPVPKPVYNDEFIQTLPQQNQAMFARLPPGKQLELGPMLSGKTAPPESGRAMTDPQLKNNLRLAALISPGFNEQVWRQRNKMASEYVDMTPNKLGGMRASSQKVLNHVTDALNDAADMNNDSWGGSPGNWVDNSLVQQAPPGAIGNSAAKKDILKSAQAHKQGVGDEFEKMMAGGPGAQTAKEQSQRLLDEDQDLSSTIGGAAGVAGMMKGQVEPQLDAYNEAMGTHLTIDQWLGPQAAAKYKVITQLSDDVRAGKKVTHADVKAAIAKLKTQSGPSQLQDLIDKYRTKK